MIDLLSSTDKNNHHHVIEMAAVTTAISLDKFFENVELVKDDLKELQRLYLSLRASHERSKTLHSRNAVKELRYFMDADMELSIRRAKLIKSSLENLDRSNQASLSLPDCGPGSSSERSRSAVVSGLRKKLKDSMESFSKLNEQISCEYRDTVQRRYYAVTGENADDKTVDLLISTGESETFLQKAIEQQGRASIIDIIQEIQERHGAVKEIESNLNELHQVFMDMAKLVQTQGQELDNIESHLTRANSYVMKGVQQLQVATQHQKNSRKRTCFAIILILIIIIFFILIIVFPIVLKKYR